MWIDALIDEWIDGLIKEWICRLYSYSLLSQVEELFLRGYCRPGHGHFNLFYYYLGFELKEKISRGLELSSSINIFRQSSPSKLLQFS